MEENQAHIPEGWSEDSLGNILNYEQPYNYTVDSTEYNDSSGIPVLTAGKSFILGYTNEYYDVYRNTPVIIFDDFTTDSKFVDFPFKVKSSAMKFLKPKNPKELNIQVIFGHIQNLKIRETGGDHKRRWISEFSKLKVVLPPFKEQTQIATILSKVDEAIAYTEQLIAKYTRIKTGLMQDLLTKGIDENGNIRSEETHEFKDSPLGRIPKEWDAVSVEEFASKQQYAIVDGPFGSNLKTIHYRTKGIPIIQSGFVTKNRFEAREYLYVDKELFEREIRSKVVAGDIVMAKIGANCGTCAILPIDHPESIIAGNSLKITVDSRYNSNLFLLLILHNYYSNGKFQDVISTTAQPAINMQGLKQMLIPKPKKNEQILISEAFDKISNLLSFYETSLNKLQSLKTGIMQDLLSGKVRVNHLNKETASV